MLDVSLQDISAGALHDLTLRFGRCTHTAVIGPAGSGASTLLRVISGELHPDRGQIRIGARDVTRQRAARRPLLSVTSSIDAPARWSVRHLLIAAVRRRTLDRQDRQREYEIALEKWHLGPIAGRALRTLSSSERTLAHLARIELLRPAILVADRLLAMFNPSAAAAIADELHRTLRVLGTTVISAPATLAELGLTDRVVVLDRGSVAQQGLYADLYRRPASEAVAIATGEANFVPVTLRSKRAESPIGSWDVESPPFEGAGMAVVRPEHFQIAAAGEESDLIFGIEEASFREGRWLATGVLTGGLKLRVVLPGELLVDKGRLIALRFDPSRFTLLPGPVRHLQLPSWFGISLG